MLLDKRLHSIFYQQYSDTIVLPGLVEVPGFGVVCKLSWQAARDRKGFLDALARTMQSIGRDVVWFSKGADPYLGNKPFEVLWVGMKSDNSLEVVVEGQWSTRIEHKWTRRFHVVLGRPVHLSWKGGKTK